MRWLGFLALGFLAGIGFSKVQQRFAPDLPEASAASVTTVNPVPTDRVTIPRAELKQLLRGILVVDDERKEPDFRYVSESGSIAFECPTHDACNLEVPARPQASATQTITRVIIQGADNQDTDQLAHSSAKSQSLDPSAIYERLGIQEGDVFVTINNEGVASSIDAFAMLTALHPSEIVELTVRRAGKEIKLTPQK